MANGLSTLTAMDGLARGYSLGQAFQNDKEDRKWQKEQRERQMGLQDAQAELTGMQLDEAKRNQLLTNYKQDINLYRETGQLPDDFSTKYASLGVGKLMDPARRDELQDMGTIFHRAQTTGDWDNPDLLSGANILLKDQLAAREAKDGLKRRIAAARQLKDGRVALELEVTGKDGKTYRAPMTRNGRSDKGDMVIAIDEQKLNGMYEAAVNQANMAYLADRAGDDPKAMADILERSVFGAPKTGDYTIQTVYDQETGTKRTAAIDNKTGKLSHYIGGAERTDSGKTAPGDKPADFSDLFAAMNKIDSNDIMTPEQKQEALAQINERAQLMYGATMDELMRFQQIKRNSGDYTPLTYSEINEMKSGYDMAAQQRTQLQQEQQKQSDAELAQVRSQALSMADAALPPPEPRQQPVMEEPKGPTRRQRQDGLPRGTTGEEFVAGLSDALSGDREYSGAANSRRSVQAKQKERNRQSQIASLRQQAQVATSPDEARQIAMQIAKLTGNDYASLETF